MRVCVISCLFACLHVCNFVCAATVVREWRRHRFSLQSHRGFSLYMHPVARSTAVWICFLGVSLLIVYLCLHVCSLRDVGRGGSVAYMSMQASPMYISPVLVKSKSHGMPVSCIITLTLHNLNPPNPVLVPAWSVRFLRGFHA